MKNKSVVTYLGLIILVLLVVQCSSLKPQTAGTEARMYQAGRSYLEIGSDEASGYGLYSYVLFTERPDNSLNNIYQNLILSYLKKIENINDVAK